MKLFKAWIMVGACVSGCVGTETDNPAETDDTPLVHFENSECKSSPSSDPGQQQQPLVVSSEADGLQCISWDPSDDGGLRLRLTNFDGPCATEWAGEAQVTAEGFIELILSNPGCLIAACGTCIYDFDFELAGVTPGAERLVRVAFDDCLDNETRWTHETVLPEGEPSGSVCRPIPRGALGWAAIRSGSCGTYNMPCGDQCDGSAGCDEGLTCVDIGSEDYRCLEACSAGADCSSPLMACQSETCRPAATF